MADGFEIVMSLMQEQRAQFGQMLNVYNIIEDRQRWEVAQEAQRRQEKITQGHFVAGFLEYENRLTPQQSYNLRQLYQKSYPDWFPQQDFGVVSGAKLREYYGKGVTYVDPVTKMPKPEMPLELWDEIAQRIPTEFNGQYDKVHEILKTIPNVVVNTDDIQFAAELQSATLTGMTDPNAPEAQKAAAEKYGLVLGPQLAQSLIAQGKYPTAKSAMEQIGNLTKAAAGMASTLPTDIEILGHRTDPLAATIAATTLEGLQSEFARVDAIRNDPNISTDERNRATALYEKMVPAYNNIIQQINAGIPAVEIIKRYGKDVKYLFKETINAYIAEIKIIANTAGKEMMSSSERAKFDEYLKSLDIPPSLREFDFNNVVATRTVTAPTLKLGTYKSIVSDDRITVDANQTANVIADLRKTVSRDIVDKAVRLTIEGSPQDFLNYISALKSRGTIDDNQYRGLLQIGEPVWGFEVGATRYQFVRDNSDVIEVTPDEAVQAYRTAVSRIEQATGKPITPEADSRLRESFKIPDPKAAPAKASTDSGAKETPKTAAATEGTLPQLVSSHAPTAASQPQEVSNASATQIIPSHTPIPGVPIDASTTGPVDEVQGIDKHNTKGVRISQPKQAAIDTANVAEARMVNSGIVTGLADAAIPPENYVTVDTSVRDEVSQIKAGADPATEAPPVQIPTPTSPEAAMLYPQQRRAAIDARNATKAAKIHSRTASESAKILAEQKGTWPDTLKKTAEDYKVTKANPDDIPLGVRNILANARKDIPANAPESHKNAADASAIVNAKALIRQAFAQYASKPAPRAAVENFKKSEEAAQAKNKPNVIIGQAYTPTVRTPQTLSSAQIHMVKAVANNIFANPAQRLKALGMELDDIIEQDGRRLTVREYINQVNTVRGMIWRN